MYLVTVIETNLEPICSAYKCEVEARRQYRLDVESVGREWAEGTIVILSHVNQHYPNSPEYILDKI